MCICCSVLKKSKVITYFTNGSKYDILQYINCNNNNVIYVINSETCRVQYVGHTSHFTINAGYVNTYPMCPTHIPAMSLPQVSILLPFIKDLLPLFSVMGIGKVSPPHKGR